MAVKDMAKAKQAPTQINVKTFTECWERGYDNVGNFAEDFLDIPPHPGQRAWWDRVRNDGVQKPDAGESCLSCSNRWGKTFSVGIKLLHRAFYQIRDDRFRFDAQGRLRPYRAINIAMSLDQAMLAWNYALAAGKNSKKFAQFVVKEVGAPFPRIEISNGRNDDNRFISEIWARSTAKRAKYLLGKSFNFCNYDEAAFDMDGDEILNQVLRARLFDEGGELDMTSSPNGKNWYFTFYQLGQGDDPHFFSRTGAVFENVNPYTKVSNVDVAAIRRSEKYMPEDHRQQNIYGLFADLQTVFPITAIQRCYAEQNYGYLLPLAPGNFVKFADTPEGYAATGLLPVPEARYVVGADIARETDETVVITLLLGKDGQPHQIVSIKSLSKTNYERIYDLILGEARKYYNARVLIDSNGAGDVVLEELQKRAPDMTIEGHKTSGSGQEKDNLIINGVVAIQNQMVRFPYIDKLVKQLTYYQWKDAHLKTDYVFAFCLAVEAALRVLSPAGPTILMPDSDIYVVRYGRNGAPIITGGPKKPERPTPRDRFPRDNYPYGDDEDDPLRKFAFSLV